MIPVIDLKITEKQNRAIKKRVSKVIDSRSYILGKELDAFEKEFAKITKVKKAIGVGNGTDALRLSLRALGIGAGDKVLTVSLTSPFTAIAIIEEGAVPVFCDVDENTWTIDPRDIIKRIDKKVKAIIPVHLYGNPSDMKSINKIAKKFNLKVVEDACQAHLAQIDNILVGNWGDAAAFSFYPTKNLGAMGDAGAVVTNNGQLAKHIRILRHGGQTKRFWHAYSGFDSRLDEIQAAVLRVKLKSLKKHNTSRSKIARTYKQELANLPISFQQAVIGGKSANHLFVIRVKQRDKLHKYLLQNGVASDIYYPYPVHVQPAFKKFSSGSLPITEKLTKELLALPFYPNLSAPDQKRVIRAIKSFFKNN